MDQATKDVVDALVAKGPAVNFRLFLDYVDDEPDSAWLPASALRILARTKQLPADGIDALAACLVASPDLGSFVHLAKALAAFGRRSVAAEDEIARRIDGIVITTDEDFWIFDSGLHVLGYVGSESSIAYLEGLIAESKPRVSLSDGVYRGTIDGPTRTSWYHQTLASVLARLLSDDSGVWDKKLTEHKLVIAQEEKKLSPWMVR